MAGFRVNGSVPSLPPPRPKSPPEYPDLYGKRRELAKVQMLEREIGFLEEELKSVEGLQPASRSCKEVADFVTGNVDPLIPTNKKTRRSCRFWKWLCGASCFNVSWICCCNCSPCPEKPHCSNCTICNCSSACPSCRMPDCNCCSCRNSQCFKKYCTCSWKCCTPKCPSCFTSCSTVRCSTNTCCVPKCPKLNISSCCKRSSCCCYPCYLCY